MKRSRYTLKQTIHKLPPNFIELGVDECTKEFLLQAKLRRSAAKDALASAFKNLGYSLTDANGLVDRGRMFVFGKSHLEKLFKGEVPKGDLLLDVGAGDGNITSYVSNGFKRVIATEYSKPMVKRLRDRGYVATSQVDVVFDNKLIGNACYDLVMLLNVLDRADQPLSLLKQLRTLLKPESGYLLLAVVLPWCPFVEVGKEQKRPSEVLPMKEGTCGEGASFEDSVSLMAKNVLIPAGFEIISWTKLPYLCEGDANREYYVLDDAVFLLKATQQTGDDDLTYIEPGILNAPPDETTAGVADWLFKRLA